MRSIENEKKVRISQIPLKKLPILSMINPKKFTFSFPIHHSSFCNLDTERGKRGLDNMEINK